MMNRIENIALGNVLRRLRMERTTLTLEQVSSRFGKKKMWLSRIERGIIDPYFQDVKMLAGLYRIELDELDFLIKKEERKIIRERNEKDSPNDESLTNDF